MSGSRKTGTDLPLALVTGEWATPSWVRCALPAVPVLAGGDGKGDMVETGRTLVEGTAGYALVLVDADHKIGGFVIQDDHGAARELGPTQRRGPARTTRRSPRRRTTTDRRG